MKTIVQALIILGVAAVILFSIVFFPYGDDEDPNTLYDEFGEATPIIYPEDEIVEIIYDDEWFAATEDIIKKKEIEIKNIKKEIEVFKEEVGPIDNMDAPTRGEIDRLNILLIDAKNDYDSNVEEYNIRKE